MEHVKFIRELSFDIVPKHDDIRSIDLRYFGGVADLKKGDGIAMDDLVEVRAVSINHLTRHHKLYGREDVYIAYSPEVEELIGVPFQTLNNQIVALEGNIQSLRQQNTKQSKQIDRFMNLNFLQRLAFLFRGSSMSLLKTPQLFNS